MNLDKRTHAYKLYSKARERFPDVDSELLQAIALMLGEIVKKRIPTLGVDDFELPVSHDDLLDVFNLPTSEETAPAAQKMLAKSILNSGIRNDDLPKLRNWVLNGGIDWYINNNVPFTVYTLCKRLKDFVAQARANPAIQEKRDQLR